MATKAEISRALGFSPSYINQLVDKGMPTDSIEAAIAWKNLNVGKREATNRKFKPAAAINSAPTPPVGPSTPPEEEKREDGETEPPDDGTLESALRAAVEVHQEAKRLVKSAMRRSAIPEIPPLLAIHNKALEARYEGERQYREELEKRGELVPAADAISFFRKGIDALVTKIKRLPQSKAPLCNPQAPMLAFQVLEESVREILLDAQKILKEYVKPE